MLDEGNFNLYNALEEIPFLINIEVFNFFKYNNIDKIKFIN
jgi:hypothetical protein